MAIENAAVLVIVALPGMAVYAFIRLVKYI